MTPRARVHSGPGPIMRAGQSAYAASMCPVRGGTAVARGGAAVPGRLGLFCLLAGLLAGIAAGPARAATPYDKPALAQAELGHDTHASVTAGGLSAVVDVMAWRQCGAAMVWRRPDPQAPPACTVARLRLFDLNHPNTLPVTYLLTPYGADSGLTGLRLSLYRLDNASPLPQVMVSAYSGGAHCCEITSIFGQSAGGRWSTTPLGEVDGDAPPRVVDIAHDGTAQLVGLDQSFFYRFAPYSNSYTPLVLQRYHDGALQTVTRDPLYSAFIAQDLVAQRADWVRGGRADPNGFLAYLVGTRANLGQLPQGWRDMLDHAAPSPPMFGLSLCDLRAAQGRTGPEPCPEKERQILPFPQALAGFLVANHYLTSDQAAILPVVLPPAAPPQGNASALPAGQFPAGQPPVGQSPVDQSPVGHSPVGHSLVGQSLAGQDQAAFSGADGRGHARYWPDFSCKLPPWNDAIATMLCQSSEAARHELMFDQVYYALRQTMGSGALGSLTQDVLANENAAYQRCGLPLPGQPSRSLPANAVPCYAAAMDRLAEHYRQRLSGPAREESARPLETHIAVQHKLVALGYLPAAMVEDGVYGAPTRHAIMTWQRIRQSPRVDGLLSDTEAALLLSAPMALPPPSEMLADAAAPGGAADTASDGAPNGAPNGGSNAASNGAPGSTRQAAQMVDNAAPESGPESVEEQGEDAAGSSGGGQPSPVGGVQAAAGSGLATASATGAVGGPETIPDSGFDDAAQDDATPPVSGLSSLSGPSLSVSAPSGAGRHAPFRQALVLVVSALGLCLYFAPFAVACRRDIDRKGMVLGVNLLLGWSVIGWAVALAMALSGQRRRRSGQIILP